MASFVGHPLNAAARALIEEWAQSSVLKAGGRLEKKIASRPAKVFVGMVLGFSAIIFMVVATGLLGL